MRTDRRWARFYFDDFIRDYPEVYRDDAAFAAWMRLLVVAEKAWPAVPELPRAIRSTALRTLTDRGLVAIGPDHTYALKGFTAERERRHATGRTGAVARWDANASAHADTTAMPIRERERDENESPLPRRAGKRSDGTNPRALGTNPRANGTSPRQVREAEKRGGAESIHAILERVAKQ